jgi:PEP-CTERM motif
MQRNTFGKGLFLSLLAILAAQPADAVSTPATFTKLTGLTGGVPADTAVYRADLSGLGLTSIESITIQDNSGGLGGSPGQFSGFDLDAIKLASSSVATAPQAAALVNLGGFNFSPAGTLFTPGTQRPPPDPALFGTMGGNVNNAVATLGSFDANSTTGPTAFGFVSMGDNGILTFNLTSPISTSGLFLYIGEVGDNGEVAAGAISVSDQPVTRVPEPALLVLVGAGLVTLMAWARRAV